MGHERQTVSYSVRNGVFYDIKRNYTSILWIFKGFIPNTYAHNSNIARNMFLLGILTRMGSPSKGYVKKIVIDPPSNQVINFSAILLEVTLFVAVAFTMIRYVEIVRPGVLDLGITEDQGDGFIISFNLKALVTYLAVLTLTLILHESLHGVVYWRVGGRRPAISLKGIFIYVSAPPEVYFQRNKYLWVGATPIILITLVGVLLVPFLPSSLMLLDVLFVALNAAGSSGDLVMILMLLRYPSSSLIRDLGSGMEIYELNAA